jgi:signal transduction histidine kinase
LPLLAYVCILAATDYAFRSPGPAQRFYYLSSAVIALLFLGISFWRKAPLVLGKRFVPTIIVLISALPILFNQVFFRYLFTGPLPSPEATLTRVAPFLMIALLLIAWNYRWQHIIIFTLSISIINLAILRVYTANDASFVNGLTAILTQVVTFLVAGLFVNLIITWLRRQGESLEAANLKLIDQARTIEELARTRERSRIAQELHDTLSHTLSGLAVQLETMKAYWDVDNATSRELLDKSLASTRAGLEETRRVLMALRAGPLDELGLSKSIRVLAEHAAEQGKMDLDLDIGDIPELSEAKEDCIFRVAQESFTNTLKHSHARSLKAGLNKSGNTVQLQIEDDGIGFDTAKELSSRSFGIRGMRERVASAGGTLRIESKPGLGTTVRLVV